MENEYEQRIMTLTCENDMMKVSTLNAHLNINFLKRDNTATNIHENILRCYLNMNLSWI